MRSLFSSSEVFPCSKAGGLADVVGALPYALAELGHEARPAPLWAGDVEVLFDGCLYRCGLGTLEQVEVHFPLIGHPYVQRDGLYEHSMKEGMKVRQYV